MSKLTTRHSPLAPSPPLRVAFVTSHPIQYQVPVFRYLAAQEDVDFQVFFAMLPDAAAQGAGFGVEFEWDLPLLEGYPYEVLENVAADPGMTHFAGCDTPGIDARLKAERIDVVVVNGWVVKTCVQALRACRRLRIPCVVRGEANHLRPRPWWKRMMQRQLVRRYDAFLPIGSANRDFYQSYGIDDSLMFDARYCVENSRFQTAADQFLPDRAKYRRRWAVEENETCFLFCGKFEPKKHPLELIRALEKACEFSASVDVNGPSPPAPLTAEGSGLSLVTNTDSLTLHSTSEGVELGERRDATESGTSPPRPETGRPSQGEGEEDRTTYIGERGVESSRMRLLMVGDGELRRECEAYAVQRGLPVTFAGFLNQSEIVQAYLAADCLVLPSDHGETWGLVVNEAMACGLPAIVSDQVGCARDLIRDGETGWVFPFGDWDRLAEQMRLVAMDCSQLGRMRDPCLRLIENYTPEAAGAGIVSAVRFVTAARGAASS